MPAVTMGESTPRLKVPKVKLGGHLDVGKRMFDSSGMRNFLNCPMLFYWCNVKGYRISDDAAPARYFGFIMHEVLERWYKKGDVQYALLALEQIPKSFEGTNWSKERGKAIFKLYVERYPKEPFEVLYGGKGVETDFAIPMPNGAILTGRIDMVVKWNGVVYAWDHKTSSSIGKAFFRGARPNIQFDGYVYACREIVGECGGIIINGISTAIKPQQRFGREVSERTEREMELYKVNFCRWVKEIETSISLQAAHTSIRGAWMMSTDWCSQYGGCKYAELCIYGDDPRTAARLFDIREVNNGHCNK